MNPDQVIVEFRTRVMTGSVTRPANTTAYSAGDAISTVTTDAYIIFGTAGDSSVNDSKPARLGVGTATLNRAILHSSANQATKLDAELWLFDTEIATVADNSAFAPSDAELLTLVDVIDFSVNEWKVANSGSGAAGNAVCIANNLDRPIKASTTGLLYGQLVAKNGYTPVSGEVFTVDIVVTQD